MRRLATLRIPAQSVVVLGDNGRHIMLTDPVQPLQPDQPVTLQIEYDAEGLVIVSTRIEPRLGNE